MRRNMELRDLADRPAILLEHGYVETEEETTSTLRSVWYSKTIEEPEAHLRFKVRIEFEMVISDEPTVMHDQRSYSFNGIRIDVERRQEDTSDDPDEPPCFWPVGHSYLAITTLAQAEKLVELLRVDTREASGTPL